MKIFKCIIKPIAFITLFLILLSAVSIPLFVSKVNKEYQWMSGIYSEREDSLDAVYIGSSNCYAFWNPVLAWEKYGISVYPYSCSSQPLVTDGILDSIEVVSIISEIEDMFDISVTMEYIAPQYFESVETMWEMIEELQ